MPLLNVLNCTPLFMRQYQLRLCLWLMSTHGICVYLFLGRSDCVSVPRMFPVVMPSVLDSAVFHLEYPVHCVEHSEGRHIYTVCHSLTFVYIFPIAGLSSLWLVPTHRNQGALHILKVCIKLYDRPIFIRSLQSDSFTVTLKRAGI